MVLIGDGPEKAALQTLARAIGARNVEFLDPIPKRQVPRLLAELDGAIVHATATPVYRYGISFNKLFDYMAAGKPVVFACRTAFDPVQEAGAGLTVEPDDPKSLADAYRAFAEMPGVERRRMGDRGRNSSAATTMSRCSPNVWIACSQRPMTRTTSRMTPAPSFA